MGQSGGIATGTELQGREDPAKSIMELPESTVDATRIYKAERKAWKCDQSLSGEGDEQCSPYMHFPNFLQ